MLEDSIEKAHSTEDDAPPTLSPEEENRIWRKVDLRLMPILSLMYLLSFMDRGNIGNAKIEGLTKQLHLTGNKFNITLTMFFISYCVFECPANLLLKALRPSRWLPGIMVVWGIVMMAMGFVKTYPQLIGVRLCLGFTEAGLFPGVVYYLTLWYPGHMLQYRIGIFCGAATIAGAFSGLLAFGIGYMGGIGHLEGWSWIFIIEGLATIAAAVLAFFILVDYPSTASFLTPEERTYLVWKRKYDNSSVGEDEHFALHHIVDAFTDWQVYPQTLLYISLATNLYGNTFFLPTIINSFGYSVPVSQLLTVPPYVVACTVLLIFAHYSDKYKIRSPFLFTAFLLSLIGFAINVSKVSNGAKYFGTFLIATGSYTAFPGCVTWVGNNLAGQYKRAVAMAFVIGIGNFGGAIAGNIYRSQDAPRYILGHGLEMMFTGFALIVIPTLAFTYGRINKGKGQALQELTARGEKSKLTVQELRDLGDRAPDFKYTM